MTFRKGAAVTAVVATLVAARAAPAGAKGPASGVIEGEGLSAPITVGYTEGQAGTQVVDEVGFFAVVFGAGGFEVLDEAPTDDLGPVLTVTWDLDGPDGSEEVVQHVYPYAHGGPLTYTAPGQVLSGPERTPGGWVRAPARLVTTLQALGVPDEGALRAAKSRGAGWGPIGASLAAMLVVGLGLAVLTRARARVVPAAT